MHTGKLRNITLFIFVLVVVCSRFFATPAMARTISVGVYQNHPGVFTDAQGKTQGFYIDLLEAIAHKENWDLRYVPGSWSEGLEHLDRQEIDLLVGIAFTDKHSKRYDYNSETVFINWGQVYTGKSKVSSLLDMMDKRIAGVKNDVYAEKLKELLGNFSIQHTFIELPEYQMVLRQLAEGVVDAGIVSRSNGLVNEKRFDVFKSSIVCCPMNMRFAAPKGKNHEIIRSIDNHLKHDKDNNNSFYYKSLDYWFGGIKTPFFPKWLKWLLGGGGGLLLLFIGGMVILNRQVQHRTKDLNIENAERRRVEMELRQSHDTLEQRVKERTVTLQEANRQLQSEIGERRRAQEIASQLNMHNEMILNSVGEGIYGMDNEGNATFFNPAATRMTGWLSEDVIGKNIHTILHHTRRDGTPYPEGTCQINLALKNSNTIEIDHEIFWRKDGLSFPVEYISTPTYESGVLTGGVVVFRDITSRWQEEARQTRSLISQVAIRALLETGLEPLSMEKQLEIALDIILSVAWLGFLHKGSVFLMDEAEDMLVMTAQRGLQNELLMLCARIKPGHCLCGRAALSKEIVYANAVDHRHDIVFEGMENHGQYCTPILSQGRLLGVLNIYIPYGHPNNPEEDSFISTVANTLAGLIERRRMEAQLQEVESQLRHTAHHDPLTDLPNRRYLMEILNHSIARAQREETQLAIMFIDLDKFKQINDTLGHDIGDLLLKESSKRIKTCLRSSDILARLGGDEFMAVLTTVSNKDEVGLVADRIVKSLQVSFILDGNTCHIGSSIGISFFPKDGENSDALVKCADMAMYEVKEQGRNHFRFF